MTKYLAIAVRPYPNPLRARVLALLSRLGVEVEVPPEFDGTVTNDDIIARLRGLRPDVLLVPYHALRDRLDERTSGLDLVRRVREKLAEFRGVPVVMPVSVFGQLAFDAAWRQHGPDDVVPILETDLDEDALLPVLRRALGFAKSLSGYRVRI